MGQSPSTLPPSTPHTFGTFLQKDIPSLILLKPLGSSKFTKSYLCKARHGGTFVVKIYINRDILREVDITDLVNVEEEQGPKSPPSFLQSYRLRLNQIFTLLSTPKFDGEPLYSSHPHCIPYQKYFPSQHTFTDNHGTLQPVYLIRQALSTSLNSRLTCRPFLRDVEKRYLTYQIFKCFKGLHEVGIVHNDVHSCNVFVTCYGYVLVTDFASIKPASVGGLDGFNYYFKQMNGGKRCWVAPERWKEEEVEAKAEQDVFSLGCLIIMIYLNGEEVMDLASSTRYRSGDSTEMSIKLGKIPDERVRNVAKHMISLDPTKRKTVAEYLERLEMEDGGVAFIEPIFKIVEELSTEWRFGVTTPDARIHSCVVNFKRIMRAVGIVDLEAEEFFENILEGCTVRKVEEEGGESGKAGEEVDWDEIVRESEDVIERVKRGEYNVKKKAKDSGNNNSNNKNKGKEANSGPKPKPPALYLYLQLIISQLNTPHRPGTPLIALHLLSRLTQYLDDNTRLNTLLPACIEMCSDHDAKVRGLAVKTVYEVVKGVTEFTESEGGIFKNYIFKCLRKLGEDKSLWVRICTIESLIGLAGESLQFESLRVCRKVRESNVIANEWDKEIEGLRRVVKDCVVTRCMDDKATKILFLRRITELCAFFGHEETLTSILPVTVFLSVDPDADVRQAFGDGVTSVAQFVGLGGTEQFLVVQVENMLIDVEYKVIESGVRCLKNLIVMNLVSDVTVLTMIPKYAALLLHPNKGVANEFSQLVSEACKRVGEVEGLKFIKNGVRDFMKFEVTWEGMCTASSFKESIVAPLTDEAFNKELMRLSDVRKIKRIKEQRMANSKANPEELREILDAVGVTVDGIDQADDDSIIVEGVEDDDDEIVEDKTLLAMKSYMEMASAHMTNKMYTKENEKKSQRNIVASGQIDPDDPPSHIIWYPNQKFNELNDDMTNKYSVEAPPISGHKDVGSLIRTYGLANVGSKKKHTSEDEEIEPPLEADPLIDAVLEGSWPAIAQQDLTTVELSNLAHRVKSLKIPPAGPRLGVLRVDGKPYSQHSGSVNFGGARGAEWKPKVDCLLASSSNITEHTSPVPRLSVAPDQSFFVSASHDGTSKVWEMRNLEAAVDLKSVVTYHGQNGGRVNDVTLLENSHSVATAGSDGSVHVWRIDMVGSYANTSQNQDDGTTQSQRMYYETGRVQGQSVIKEYDPCEGEALAVTHFNTDSASILLAGTMKGNIHAWDLRSSEEPFCLKMRPELGYMSSLAMGTDRNWLVAGTSRGYVALFDVRYHMMVKLWRHECHGTINRLATCFTRLPQESAAEGPRPYVFVAAGKNEASIFDIGSGRCAQSFRMLGREFAGQRRDGLPDAVTRLPKLEDVALPSRYGGSIKSATRMAMNMSLNAGLGAEPSVRALMGRISETGSRTNSYLVTGGSDKKIVHWDFTSPSKCYGVSGVEGNDKMSVVGVNRSLFLGIPNASSGGGKNMKGGVRPSNGHHDAVLDLKSLERPKAMLSSGGDGVVKVWR
ncbi:hypothetical protein TrST_g6288 [Triparma strigata]|uniref:non-specific serine/threonine protein kinase n=1 Tax=Triparma strigata TaxID=1606541 RepID=A0A9W7EZ91_9STRA|nr:hypothetical protein TrST_g6288 [Triparma strigata]